MILNPMWIVGGFTTADWTAESNQAFAWFGQSVSSAGDVNGDGFGDVVVGAWGYDNGETDEGRAFVYLGSPGGLAAAAGWITESNQLYAQFGYAAAGAGDVNGDGFDDVLVSAHHFDNGLAQQGRVSAFHGSAVGLDTIAAWTVYGDQDFGRFGNSVGTAGDVNGDGFDDVIIGERDYDYGEGQAFVPDEGRAHVYYGSATGLSTVPSWTAESNLEGALFGDDVESAGDINGDGFDDVIVGSLGYSNGETDEGRAFVYLGSATGLAAAPAWTTESDQEGAVLGNVSSAGDVNADGFDDVLVGAPHYDNGQTNEGRAYLFLGSATGLDTVPAWTTESDDDFGRMGAAVATAGDVNADGFDDVVIGCWYCDVGTVDEGAAFVFLGTATGLETTAEFIVDSGQAISSFGTAVAPAGDVDGDGYDDILVGALQYDNGETDEGRAYLFEGTCADPIDTDGDEIGDLCDVCPGFDDRIDTDIDGFADDCDLCPAQYDPLQEDDDSDGIGDACDSCPAGATDSDGDGFCGPEDCDDTNPTAYSGASEVCDGVDNDCDDVTPAEELDGDGDGEPICAGDCDDADPELFTGQTETCNGIDDNCDIEVPADELDGDEDGYTICDGDCDDANRLASPAQSELCSDAIDNDCDGEVNQDCGEDTGCSCNGTGGVAGGPALLALALLLRSRRRA